MVALDIDVNKHFSICQTGCKGALTGSEGDDRVMAVVSRHIQFVAKKSK